MSKIINKIQLTEEEIAYLESVLRQPTGEARAYVRSKILLLKHKGYTSESIAYKLDISLSSVKLCLRKFSDGGMEAALNDRKGRGRKREISDSDITWVIDKACEKPTDHGYSAELWYPATFTRFIRSVAGQEGHPRMADVSESTLRAILRNAKLLPFKVTYYCEKRDPDFKEKMHGILAVDLPTPMIPPPMRFIIKFIKKCLLRPYKPGSLFLRHVSLFQIQFQGFLIAHGKAFLPLLAIYLP